MRQRQRLSGTDKRSKSIIVRVNDTEYEAIKRNAGASNIASYVRTAAMEKKAPPETAPQEKNAPAIISGTPGRVSVDALRNIELLAALSDDTIMAVFHKLKVRRYRKNDLVFLQEDSNNYVYFILNGSVKVTQLSEDGKEIIIAIHQAGSFFGEMSLIDGTTVSANVYSAESSVIGLLSGEDFYSLLYGNREVLQSLLKILCRRIRSSNDKIEILNTGNASQRIKIMLILMSKKNGTETAKGILLNTRATHQDIANLTGLTRETVTRAINKWLKHGDISISDRKAIHLNHSFFTTSPTL